MKDFLSTADVGERLGITPRRAWELVKEGRIPFVKHGRNIRIPRAAWERFVEAQTEEALAGMNGGKNMNGGAINGGVHAQAA